MYKNLKLLQRDSEPINLVVKETKWSLWQGKDIEIYNDLIEQQPRQVPSYADILKKESQETPEMNYPFKTRMCYSVDLGIQCKNGDNCRYAHTIEELRIMKCPFGNKCKMIKIEDNVIKNKNTDDKTCNRIHPLENQLQFLIRNNMKRFLSREHRQPQQIRRETTLRVTKENAVNALELALKAGSTSIKIEII